MFGNYSNKCLLGVPQKKCQKVTFNGIHNNGSQHSIAVNKKSTNKECENLPKFKQNIKTTCYTSLRYLAVKFRQVPHLMQCF